MDYCGTTWLLLLLLPLKCDRGASAKIPQVWMKHSTQGITAESVSALHMFIKQRGIHASNWWCNSHVFEAAVCNWRLRFSLRDANCVESPAALRVGGEQIIMAQRQFSACALRFKLFCGLVHGGLAFSRTRPWRSGLWHRLRNTPVAAKSLFCSFNGWMNNSKK